jgi:hypothetical protein
MALSIVKRVDGVETGRGRRLFAVLQKNPHIATADRSAGANSQPEEFSSGAE